MCICRPKIIENLYSLQIVSSSMIYRCCSLLYATVLLTIYSIQYTVYSAKFLAAP